MSSRGSGTSTLIVLSTLVVVLVTATHLPRPPNDEIEENSLAAVQRYLLRRARVEAVKRGILQQLGLTEAPRPPPRNGTTDDDVDRLDIDPHVMTAYRRSLIETRGRSHATGNDVIEDVEEVVPQAKQFYSFKGHVIPGNDCDPSAERTLLFRVEIPEVKDRNYETVVMTATLKLYARRPRHHRAQAGTRPPEFFHVTVYHLLDAARRRQTDDINSTEVRQVVTAGTIRSVDAADEGEGRSGRWEEFDVKSAVEKHLAESGGKGGVLQLEVKVTSAVSDEVRHSGLEFGDDWCHEEEEQRGHRHNPLLNILTRDRPLSWRHIRARRSVALPTDDEVEPLCTLTDSETRCCRRSLWISFRDLGWHDWILAPEGYQAYYCEGTCPPGHLTAHNYAAIRQLLLSGIGGSGRPPPPIPLPTCSATRLSPLPLVHYLGERRVVSIFDDMIVEECKCA